MLTRSLIAIAILSKPWLVCNPQPVPADPADSDSEGSSTGSSTTDVTSESTVTGPTSTTATTDTMPVCGNGQVEDAEECDDGNQVAEDACLATCKSAICGDDIVWSGMEECDDGDQDDTNACTAGCKNAFCGDGLVWAGMEECDDGNMIDDDACTNQCKGPVCGDGMKVGNEECDDGNMDDTDACVACKNAACGDGKVHAGVEECDDGNTDKADGCSEICAHEYLMFVTKNAMPADMGGVAGADTACQTAAGIGGLTGTYVAWISAAGDAASGDIPTGKPLIRTDGMPIVANASDLYKGGMTMLMNPIDHDEEGNAVTGYAWTGTSQSGVPSGSDCAGWTTTNLGATVGSVSSTTLEWTNIFPNPPDPLACSAMNHLYCFRKLEP